ncbi:MAG TPA: hypothetical protein VL346_02750 [Acidobacteriaceae bacterium]|nr:hypothetical protein [Acidobacteriaceae bacterium]
MHIPSDLRDWLLTSDPAIRYQTLRDLTNAPPEELAAARARIETEGWGARLLALNDPDGQWDGGACFPGPSQYDKSIPGQPWTSTLPVLQLLQEFGIDPTTPRLRKITAQVRHNCHWEHDNQPFFEGEVEPCINGRVVTLGVYFGGPIGIDVTPIVHSLLAEQIEDGGWNCETENGSTVSSFATTLNVLEGLLAYEQALTQNQLPATPIPIDPHELTQARRRAEEYLLTRHLFRRLSTGAVVDPEWLQFSFPVRWRYDILRALDYFRLSSLTTNTPPDPRLHEAIEILRNKQQRNTADPSGAWLLENTHRGKSPFPLEDGDHQLSRWNTLRALRVLHWYDSHQT